MGSRRLGEEYIVGGHCEPKARQFPEIACGVCLSTMRFFASLRMTRGKGLRMTGSEGLGMIPLFCHCEADFVSRSNLMEGQGIAAYLFGARNDIRDFSLVLHDPKGSHYRIWRGRIPWILKTDLNPKLEQN